MPLVWVALVPWLLALERTRSLGGALAAGLAMSLAFATMVFPWFPHMVADYTGAPWVIGAVVLVAVAPLLQPQFVAFAAVRHCVRGAPAPLAALAGASAYVGAEWAVPKLFADTLGHGLHGSAWLRQAADLGGAHGLTFVLVLANECVLALVRAAHAGRSSAAPAAALVALAGALAGYGALRLSTLERGAAGPVTVAVVQANIAHYDRLRAEIGTFDAVSRILDAHVALSADALARDRPDLLVWPETVYPTTFGAPKSPEGADFDDAIAGFVARTGVPLLFGTYGAADGREYNTAVLLAPDGNGGLVADAYRKRYLFPFTEYLPWPLESPRVRRWLPWAGRWTPGDRPRVLEARARDGRPIRLAPLVCYDALEPGFVAAAARGDAGLLAILSNDSWFAYPGVQRLILIVSAFRSVETRRPQLRATPTGTSAVIDETGAIADTLAVDRPGVLVGTVRPAAGARTLVLAWGDWFPPVALAGAVVALLAARRRRTARPAGAAPS